MDSEQLVNTINKINRYEEPVRRMKSSLNASSRPVAKRRKKSAQVSSAAKIKITAFVILCIAIVAALSGIIGYRVWYNSFTDISLAEYTGVTLNGYDKHGTAELDIIGKSEYASFFRTVSAKMSVDSNLSNGDEIVITYDYDEEAAKENKLRIDPSEAVVTVDGLLEATVISKDMIFSGLSVNFDGLSPCIEISVENISEEPISSEVEFSVENGKTIFESGEEVKISATIPEEYTDNPAYEIEMSDADYVTVYTVPETDEYMTDPAQITPEILSQLENAGYDLISKADAKEYGLRIFQQEAHIKPVFVGNTTTFQWKSPYVISAYFHNVTEKGKEVLESHANDVQIVYGVTITQQDGTSCQAEMVIQFIDLVVRQDGTTDLNLDSGRIVSASYRNSNIKKLVTDDNNGTYETTKLTD